MSFLPFRPYEVVAAFHDHTHRPRQDQLDAMMSKGIGIWSLAGAPGSGEFGVAFCRIRHEAAHGFDFDAEGEPALAVVALDAFGEPADIAAWTNRPPWIGTWLGAVAMLGAPDAFGARFDPVLTVHTDPMAWLRAGRVGIVLIDTARAAIELQGFGPFRAADVEHGLALQAMLTPPMPPIVVSLPERIAA